MKSLYFLITLFFITSCTGFLTDKSQDLSYVNTYNDLDELLVGGGYMKSDFDNAKYSYYPYIHAMADELQENIVDNYTDLDYTGYCQKWFGFHNWQKDVTLSFEKTSKYQDDNTWNKIYEHINVVNMILSDIQSREAKSKKDELEIDRIKGESYFLRAYYYFILVNLYGKPYSLENKDELGVPIKLTEYVEDKKFKRNTIDEVYRQITEDLNFAEKYLLSVVAKSKYRASISAVYLLKSRVYLYMQNWDMAKKYSEKCLSQNDELVNLNNFDINNSAFANTSSPEVIFTMGGNQIKDIASYKLKGFGVSADLYKLYSDDDLRRSIFFVNDLIDIACVKYSSIIRKSSYSLSLSTPNVSDNNLMRTSEAYLNLAESLAYIGDMSTAQEILDKLRVNRIANDKYKKVNLIGQDLVDAIREERRKELCLEGHRWFDLRRWAVSNKYKFVAKLTNTYTTFNRFRAEETYFYEMNMDDWGNVLPIPIEVADFNGMTNNDREERVVKETKKY